MWLRLGMIEEALGSCLQLSVHNPSSPMRYFCFVLAVVDLYSNWITVGSEGKSERRVCKEENQGKLRFAIREYKAPTLCFHGSVFPCFPMNRQCGRNGGVVGIEVIELWNRIIYTHCHELW